MTKKVCNWSLHISVCTQALPGDDFAARTGRWPVHESSNTSPSHAWTMQVGWHLRNSSWCVAHAQYHLTSQPKATTNKTISFLIRPLDIRKVKFGAWLLWSIFATTPEVNETTLNNSYNKVSNTLLSLENTSVQTHRIYTKISLRTLPESKD